MTNIIDELKIELGLTDETDIAILTLKVKNAMREVKQAFNFKSYHKEDYILYQMECHIGNIKSLAVYDFMKIGAEGESSHDEKNIKRVYENRNRCFSGIVRFAD